MREHSLLAQIIFLSLLLFGLLVTLQSETAEARLCATFTPSTNTVHVPCFSLGDTSYWLDLSLAASGLQLTTFGDNGVASSNSLCALFNLSSSIVHIPCLDVLGSDYWLDLNLIRLSPIVFGLANFGTYAACSNGALIATGGNRPLYAGTSGVIQPWVEGNGFCDSFDIQTVSQPLKGTASVVVDKLKYTPGPGFTSGTDSFAYKVTDNSAVTVTGTAAVLVYDTSALSICKRNSTVNADGTLLSRTKANSCAFYSISTTRTTTSGTPVTMDYFISWPSSNVPPKALVVLIGGGDLDMSISGNPTTGVADTSGGGNFVVRTAQLFADAGYVAVAIDRPSDQPPVGSVDTTADADQYRISVKHAVDILTVLKHVNTENLDVFLVGTSRGTISAIANNLIATGIALSSSLTSDSTPSHLYIGRPDIVSLQPGFVKRPVHVLWHQNDLCFASTPSNSQALYNSLSGSTTAAYSIASGGVRVTAAGNGVSPDVCGAFDYHGYLGIETTAVGYITAWLDARVALLNGNKRPAAASSTITTAAGATRQTDLASLTTDLNEDSRTYALSHTTTSLGGTVSINGSTVAYTPPPGISNKTDYYVYVVTDGKGSVDAAVITVLIGN